MIFRINESYRNRRVLRGRGLFQVLGADTAPSGRVLDGGSPEHSEGKTSLGVVREATKVGGSGPNHLSKVLPRGGSGGATLWV